MKAIIIAAGVVASAMAAYAGMSYYGATRFDAQLQDVRQDATKAHGIRLTRASSDHGLFASSGTISITLDPGCFGSNKALNASLLIHYKVSHAPTLNSLMRFEAEAALAPDSPAEAVAFLGSKPLVTANGYLGYDGGVMTSFSTREIDLAVDDVQVSIAASHGLVYSRGKATRLGWVLPEVIVAGAGKLMRVGGIGARADYSDTDLGIGTSKVIVESMRADRFEFEKLSVNSVTALRGDMLDTVVKPYVETISVAGAQYRGLGFALALRGLDADAFGRLRKIQSPACGFETLTEKTLLEFESTVARLIDRGFELSVSGIRGTSNEGKASGDITLTWAPALDQPARPLLQRFAVDGRARISADLMPEAQRDGLLMTDFVQLSGDDLAVEFSFEHGQLTINDQPGEYGFANMAAMFFSTGDQTMLAWREGLAQGNSLLAPLVDAIRR